MKFLVTNKSRGWVVVICLVVVLAINSYKSFRNSYDTEEVSTVVQEHTEDIKLINERLKIAGLRIDTANTTIKALEARKRNLIYNTQIIERDHEAKINAYNKLDSSAAIGFLTDWIIEQERLSETE